MSIAVRNGANDLNGPDWQARVLTAPPLIAPARQYTFPFAIAGEEDALARGALWLEIRTAIDTARPGTWLAQCALGFAGEGVAQGLWPLPGGSLLACAGGYAYAIDPGAPERTVLLPPRPAVAIISLPSRTVLVTHHSLLVREADGDLWATPRLSWEGVTVTLAEDDVLAGVGWDMLEDAERPFTVDLRQRTAVGGGFTQTASGAL